MRRAFRPFSNPSLPTNCSGFFPQVRHPSLHATGAWPAIDGVNDAGRSGCLFQMAEGEPS